MSNNFISLHPRRLWLWWRNINEIKITADRMLPRPYAIETLIAEYRPDVEQFKAAGVLDYSNTLPSKTNRNNDSSILHEATLGAAEGAVLYSHGILDQLHLFDTHFAHALVDGLKVTLLNSSNLSIGLAGIAAPAQAKIPSALLPLAQPIINHCVESAETWCHEHLLNASMHATGLTDAIPGTADVHGDILLHAAGGLHEAAWLDPAGNITDHPFEVVATHLEHADTVGQAGDVLEHGIAASEAAGHAAHAAVGTHIPIFTLLRSGYREYGLLQSGKTDAGSAAKNISIDAGSMMVGLKAGAIAGSIFGPIGTAIGAALGGMGGKLFGNKIKHANLNEAIAEFEKQATSISESRDKLESTVTGEFNKHKLEEQTNLNEISTQLESEITRSAQTFIEFVEAKSRLYPADTKKIIAEALTEINKRIEDLNQHLANIGTVKRILWPNVQTEAIRLASSMAIARKNEIESTVAIIQAKGNIKVMEFLNVFSQSGVAENGVREMLLRYETERKQHENIFQERLHSSQKGILEKRFEAVGRLDLLMKNLARNVEETIKPMALCLDVISSRILTEKQKLGLV